MLLPTKTEPSARDLHAALIDGRTDAARKWAAFETERKRLEAAGVDLMKDAAAFERLEQLKGEYDRVAADVEKLNERLMKQLEGDVPGSSEGRLDGIGAKFLEGMGAGSAGLKALDGTSGGTLVGPFYDERIRKLPTRQLFVRSLIPVRQAEGDKVWYLRQTTFTNAAAPVAAGAEKPRSTITVERIEEAVRTIAHVTEAIDRALLSDFDELVDFLDSELRLGVLLAEEAQILFGNGTSPDLRGILNTTGIGSVARGTESRADAIHRAITAVRLNFFEPDAVVVHPNDWEDIRLEKDADGNYIAGPVTAEGLATLFGKQVITSPVLTAGTALVGNFAQGATIWDREEARVTFTEAGLGDSAGQELFTRNQIRFRGEERIAFGVERPAAFSEVTNL